MREEFIMLNSNKAGMALSTRRRWSLTLLATLSLVACLHRFDGSFPSVGQVSLYALVIPTIFDVLLPQHR